MVNRWLLYQTRRLPAVGQGRLLPGRRRLRLPRPVAGRDGAGLGRARSCCASRSLLCASRQFAEGDVQHWWHAPDRRRRAHPFLRRPALAAVCRAALHRAPRATPACSTSRCRSSKALPIPDGAEDAYYVPGISAAAASRLRALRARAIDRSLRVGAHGLPLMGTGDWNDGMNRVGHEGRGESVWLGLVPVRRRRATSRRLPRARGEAARAAAWRRGGARLARRAARRRPGTAQWYRRAFFDDGTPLGSARQRRVPHRPDRAGLGGAVRRRAAGARSARRWPRCEAAPGRPTMPACCACSTRRWPHAAAERRLHPGLPARACARTAASTRTPASGR